jgi:hypothetical protein
VKGELMIALTPQLRQEIERAGENPVRIEDPETHTAYVLMKEEVYRRLKQTVELEQSDRSLYEYQDFRPIDANS